MRNVFLLIFIGVLFGAEVQLPPRTVQIKASLDSFDRKEFRNNVDVFIVDAESEGGDKVLSTELNAEIVSRMIDDYIIKTNELVTRFKDTLDLKIELADVNWCVEAKRKISLLRPVFLDSEHDKWLKKRLWDKIKNLDDIVGLRLFIELSINEIQLYLDENRSIESLQNNHLILDNINKEELRDLVAILKNCLLNEDKYGQFLSRKFGNGALSISFISNKDDKNIWKTLRFMKNPNVGDHWSLLSPLRYRHDIVPK